MKLNKMVDEFRPHYILFTKNNELLTIDETDLNLAINYIFIIKNVKRSMILFEKKISDVMTITEQKKQLMETK